MAILFGLLLAAGLLCLWLAGGWFGRVLAFVVLAIPLGLIVSTAVTGSLDQINPVALLAGAVAAWFVGGIPAYVRRYQAKAA